MARRRRLTPRQREKEKEAKQVDDIEALGWAMLLDARGLDEEYVACVVLLIARDRRRALGRSKRYGQRGTYDAWKPLEFFESILYYSEDRYFRAWLRMDRESFWELHHLIKSNKVYETRGRKPQQAPLIQLATFLCRVGGLTTLQTAGFTAIAEGTVPLYVMRTSHALRSHRDDFIQWPNFTGRDWISAWCAARGFPGCVGQMDATYLESEVKPLENGYAFYCHKGFYAYVLQATCDHVGLITSYEFGWPGSVQDSRVFRLSDLWENREEYFRTHEYILVDKGYPLTLYSIRPFQATDLTNDPEERALREKFNLKLSGLRVKIEHVFGRLKGRFPYLRRISGFKTRDVYRIIEALLVVHNFLERRRDNPEKIPEFNGNEDDDVDEVLEDAFGRDRDRVHVSSSRLRQMGVVRRKELMNRMRR